MDLLASALIDFQKYGSTDPFYVENKYTEPDIFPLEVFYRGEEDLSELDDYALSLCQGKTLDVGAGVGSLSLILQNRGVDVTALEISEDLVEVMKKRGLKKTICTDFESFESNEKFDTIFFLMNGIGLAKNLNGLSQLFRKVKNMLNKGGQVIFDSSDIEYFYSGDIVKPENKYYGELDYRYKYKGEVSKWSTWLYVDFWKAAEISKENNMIIEHLYNDGSDQYLARLTLNE